VQRVSDRGMKITIDPEAHILDGLDEIRYCIGIASKGWLSDGDVVNTMKTEAILKFFKEKRTKRK